MSGAGLFPMPAARIELRDYQLDVVQQYDDALTAGHRAPLLVLPTGGGKTIVAAKLMERVIASGGRALFVAPRRELIKHASSKLNAVGLAHGVVLSGADHLQDPAAAAQVASLDTLMARMVRRGRLPELTDFNLVLVDEAHLAVTAKRIDLFNRWPGAVLAGLTATPIRRDGRALGVMFDCLVNGATTANLTERGHLVPVRYFSLTEPDLARVRITAGDFNGADLERTMNRPGLVGDVVAHWLRHAADRRTVVFCSSVPHSIAVAEEFARAGVAAEHVDANTPNDEREDTFKRFTRGETQVLTNCFLASYGFDYPELSCVVLARPTRSLMLYLQMIGRGLRTADDKRDCLVLDHSGCVHRHGFAHDERAWSLDGHRDMTTGVATRKASEQTERKRIDCPECHAVFTGAITCPECGYRLRPIGRAIVTLPGNLVEIGKLKPDTFDRVRFYGELRGIARERGYKPTWAACVFRERLDEWPPRAWNNNPIFEPSITTRRWIKSRAIAYAKSRQSA